MKVAASTHELEVTRFAAEVHRLIEDSPYSLRQIESMLDAYGPEFRSAIGTLSAWQTGATAPPNTEAGLNRVLALERCLDADAGQLAILIPSSDTPPTPTRPLTQIGIHNRPARAALADRHKQFQNIINRLSGPQRTIPVRTTKTYVLGRGYRPVHTMIKHKLRPANDLVDRYWFLHAPATHAYPEISEGDGCQRGRTIDEDQVLRSCPDPADGGFRLQAVELLFDRVLGRGEPYEFNFTVGYTDTDTRPDNLFRHVQSQPCELLDLRLDFRKDKPVDVAECHWASHNFTLLKQTPLTADPDGQYRQSIPSPIPGAYGWVWTAADSDDGGGGPDRD